MKRQRVWLVFLVLLTIGNSLSTRADQRGRPQAPQQQTGTQPGELKLTGQVVQIYAPRVFTVRERAGAERELLVLAPRALSPGFVGATVTVEGAVRRFSEAELKRAVALGDFDEQTRERLVGRPVLVASSVMAIAQGEPAPAVEPPLPAARAQEPEPVRRRIVEEKPLTVRTSMLAANVDVFAGQQIRLLNGRVVGVLEPRAFLIEPATPYMKSMGTRDRLLVLIGSAVLRASPELIVGATVDVTGVARTLLGVQMTREVPWPARLRPEVVERLEVRGVILATSVQTPDGVELTERQTAAAR